MNTQFEIIDFNDIIDNGTNVVMLGLIVENESEDNLKQQINSFFTEFGLFTKGVEVVRIKKIGGNVLGNEGRSDVLLELSDSISCINPIKRLQIGDIKWTEDFLVNCREDYFKDEEE